MYRPIRPTKMAKVRIEKWQHADTAYTALHPWKVLSKYPGEPGYTLIGSFETWASALRWGCGGRP